VDFTALRYFFEASRMGSIRQAAEHIHVAPSAISRQIAKLEHELGAPLFERRSSGVKLTAAGELLAGQLQSTVRDIYRVRTQIDDLIGLRRGNVVIYTIEGLVDSVVASSIAGFNARYPEIYFDVAVASTDRIIEAIVTDDADIGIALNAPRRVEVSVCSAWQEPLHVIVAPSHSLSGRNSISLEELARYPAALPDRSFGVRRHIDTMLDRAGLKPTILISTNSILTTICIARRGIAYTLMPMFAVERDIQGGTLLAIPLTDDGIELSRIEICVHRNRRLSLAAREFLSWLQANTPGAASGSEHAKRVARQGVQTVSERTRGRRRAS
jgi:DNA-binding transcriptional LysR family regulator